MGEARNAAGEVIGQAWGETRQDVLDKSLVEERLAQVGLRPGRIVYFVVDGESAARINRRREDYELRDEALWSRGVQTHVGTRVEAGEVVPAMVTRVWGGDTVNLKVMLDGNDTYWATGVSFSEAYEPRSWHWMFEGQRERYRPDHVEAGQTTA